MFARFGKILMTAMLVVIATMLGGCSNPFGGDPDEFDLAYEHSEEIVSGDACIAVDDETGKARLVELADSDEYVAVGDPHSPAYYLDHAYMRYVGFDYACFTQADVDAAAEEQAEAEERRAMEELVRADKACELYDITGREVVEYDDEFVAQDRNGTCMTQSEVDVDNRLTANIVSSLEAIEVDDWKQRASAVVDVYCGIDRLPVKEDNRTEVETLLAAAYEAGRTYSGSDYPYTFEEAKQWCPNKDVSVGPTPPIGYAPAPPPKPEPIPEPPEMMPLP